jgi:uncharacterized protein YndB with AHSA1/START domain
MAATRMRRLIDAPRERVYAALVDPTAVSRWRFPSGMTCHVHEFDAREGGTVRISLTYEAPDRAGKSGGGTELAAVHDGVPPGVSPADNEAGWREALARLAALVESPR